MRLIGPKFVALTEDLDVEAFWEEDALCRGFTLDKPRCSLSLSPDDHWIFEFADVKSTLRYYKDKAYRDELHKKVNAITQEHVGRSFFSEDTWEHEEFAEVLDRAEATDVRTWALPEVYRAEWESRKAAGKPLRLLGTGSRGPATIMTSVLKVETVFYWMVDHPGLMHRFRDILAEKMVELNTVLREFSNNPHQGWWITDDNSALFNRRLYREYCYPVLDRVLNAMAPGDAPRYQHSDSAMAHVMEMQYELGIREVNYGPEVDAALIRKTMPDALINGQMPPFLLRNGSAGEIEARVISDFEKAGSTGGLIISTAGSLAAGSGVGRMRWLMKCVRDKTRYDD